MFRFSSTFSAYSLPEDFFFASSTVPKPPSPSFESTWKSEILSAAGGAEGPPGAALAAAGAEGTVAMLICRAPSLVSEAGVFPCAASTRMRRCQRGWACSLESWLERRRREASPGGGCNAADPLADPPLPAADAPLADNIFKIE